LDKNKVLFTKYFASYYYSITDDIPSFLSFIICLCWQEQKKKKEKTFSFSLFIMISSSIITKAFSHQNGPPTMECSQLRNLRNKRQSFMSGWYLSPTIYETLVHSSWLMATMSYGSCKKTLKTGWWVGTTSFPSCSLSSHNKVVTLQFP